MGVGVLSVDQNEAQAYVAWNLPCKYSCGWGPVCKPCTWVDGLHRHISVPLIFMTQEEKVMGRDYHNIQISNPYHINIIPTPEIELQWHRPSAFRISVDISGKCLSLPYVNLVTQALLLTDISIGAVRLYT